MILKGTVFNDVVGRLREIPLSISSDHVGGVQEFVSSKTAKVYFGMNCNLFFAAD